MSAITLKAGCEIKAASDGKPATITILAYSGGLMRVEGYGAIVLSLDGMDAGEVPLLVDHSNEINAIVGMGSAEIRDGKQLYVSGVLARGTKAADQLIALAKSGVRLAASVGADPVSIQFVDGGERVEANGRSIVAPKSGLQFVTRSVLREVSVVPIGADSTTTVAIAAAKGKRVMNGISDFETWAAEMVRDPSLMTETQLATLHANYAGRTDANDGDFAAVAPMILASADPVESEQRRLRQVERACAGDWGDDAGRITELKAQAVGGELSVDQLLEAMRGIRMEQTMKSLSEGPPVVHGRRRDADGRVIEAAFCLGAGLKNIERHYPEQILDAAYPQRNDVTLSSMLLQAAAANGYGVRIGETINRGNIKAILTAAFQPQIRAANFSSISLPNTLANIANKFSMEGWMSVDQTALRICYVRPVNNFKQITTVSLVAGMEFLPIGADGNLVHGQVSEETYTNKAAPYGIMFAISFVDIRNDDAGVLSSVPRRIGRGGMTKLSDLVWTTFLNNAAFFTAGRGNLVNAEMTLGGLGIAETAFVNMVDAFGNPVGVVPAILLVPPAHKSAALTLMNSQLTTTGENKTLPSGNIWQNRFRVESSPYMAMTRYTGSSALAWYLLADPAQLPVIEIAALDGQVQPTVETADADFSTLGVQMRGHSHVGVALQEYRAGVRATGTP